MVERSAWRSQRSTATASGRRGLMRTSNLRSHQLRTQVRRCHACHVQSRRGEQDISQPRALYSSYLNRFLMVTPASLTSVGNRYDGSGRWGQLCIHARQPGGDCRRHGASPPEHSRQQQRPWQRRRGPSRTVKQPVCSPRSATAAGCVVAKLQGAETWMTIACGCS